MKRISLILWIFFTWSACQLDKSMKLKDVNYKLNSIEYPDSSLVGEVLKFRLLFDQPTPKQVRYLVKTANGYQSNVIKKHSNGLYSFALDSSFTYKKGILEFWIFSDNQLTYKGQIKMINNPHLKLSIENFFGPKFLIPKYLPRASSLTVIQDQYENLVGPGQSYTLNIHDDYGNNEIQNLPITKQTGYYYLEELKKNGYYFMATQYQDVKSKLHTFFQSASIGPSFQISSYGFNGYADGYSLIHFKSNEIKDIQGNTIQDGTYVDFVIHDKDGAISKTSGATINGIAECYIPQPAYPTEWKVKAIIQNSSLSNTLQISFKGAIDKVNYKWIKKNIIIEPIYTINGYIVADGTTVQLNMVSDSNQIHLINTTKDGQCRFNLNTEKYKKGIYFAWIEVLGKKVPVEPLNL